MVGAAVKDEMLTIHRIIGENVSGVFLRSRALLVLLILALVALGAEPAAVAAPSFSPNQATGSHNRIGHRTKHSMTLSERRAQVSVLKNLKRSNVETIYPESYGVARRNGQGIPAANDRKAGPKVPSAHPMDSSTLPAPTFLGFLPHVQFGFVAEWGDVKYSLPEGVKSIKYGLYRASDNTLMKMDCRSYNFYGGGPPAGVSTFAWDDPTIMTAGVNYYLQMAITSDPGNSSSAGYDDGTCATGWSPLMKTPSLPAQGMPIILPAAETYGCGCGDTTGRTPIQGYLGDPVNSATGAQTESATDVTVAGTGVPLTISRVYNSANPSSGLLGVGWSSPYDAHLVVSGNAVTYIADSGMQVKFSQTSAGVYSSTSAGVRSLLAGTTASGFTLTTPDGHVLAFDGNGLLSSWKDASGHGLSFARSGPDLTSVTDAAGRTAWFSIDPTTRLLSKVALADGRSVQYGYTGNHLTSVTGVDGATTAYGYDTSGLLNSIKDNSGHVTMQDQYNSSGQVIQQTDAHGQTEHFSRASQETDYTDANGGIWTDLYAGSLLRNHIDPLGEVTSYSYDTNLNLTDVTDPLGNDTHMVYDPHGNILSRTIGPVSESWTYNPDNTPATYTDGRGHVTTYSYYASGAQLKSASGPAGVTSYTYTANGQVETVTSPGNHVTRYGYDSFGNLISTTDPDGNVTSSIYDSAGRIKTQTDPRGNIEGADKAKFTTSFDYDDHGRLKTETDPLGHATSYTYDDNGNVHTVTDALQHVTTYEYDAFNRQTSVTGPDLKPSKTEYDAAGNVKATIDQLGNRTSYLYDAANHLTSMTSPRGNLSGVDPAPYTTKFNYNGAGDQTDKWDPAGGHTITAYDALNRVTSVTDPSGNTTKTTYDGNGNIATTTDARGNVTQYIYDNADRQQTVTDPLGRKTTYGYDDDGNRTSETLPSGAETKWTFTPGGLMHTQVDPRGNVSGADASKFTTTYGYDAAGNQTSVTDALGKQTVTEYDAMNNVTSVTDPLNNVTKTEYDELGRIKKVTGPDLATTSYTYNPTGTLFKRTDDNNHETTYEYDDAGRQTAVIDPLQRKQKIGYDEDGNVHTVTDARGIVATMDFDGRNLPTGTTYSDSTPAVGYTYDADGRRKTITDGTGSRTYGYDPDGRLTSVVPTTGKGAFGYSYDAAGQLSSRTQDFKAGTTLNWSGADQSVAADLNGDSITDLIRTDTTDSIHTFLGRKDGTFPGGPLTSGGGTGFTHVVGMDFTGDGKTDLMAIDRSTGYLYRYNGDGTGAFAAPVQVGPGYTTMNIIGGDFNGDGKNDLMVQDTSAASGHLYFYPGTGTGGFGTRTDLGANWGGLRLTALDFNNDHKLDLLAIYPGNGHLYFYPGNGAGNVGTRTDLSVGWTNFQLTAGDFTGDGNADFLADDTVNHALYLYPGTGSGSYTARIPQADDWTPYGVPLAGHFDYGSGLGIAATDTSSHIRTWTGDGAGRLSGALTATTAYTGSRTLYSYDADGNQHTQSGPAGTTVYRYDPAGNLATTVLPAGNGYTENRSYDNDGRLTDIGSTKAGTTLADWKLTLDDAGQPQRIDVTRAGKPTAHQYYTYDPAGRLLTDCTSAVLATQCPAADAAAGTTYTYDGVGNRSTATTDGTLTHYTYDEADELKTTLTGTATTSYTYDADGNQTGDGTNTLTYDATNRLTGITTGANTYAYGYDADGNRTSATKNGTLQRTTIWDTNNDLPQAAAEFNTSGVLTAAYQYNPLEQIQSQITSTSAPFYYHHDQLGSVTDITDATGTPQISYAYTAYGETTRTDTATTPPANPFTYTGQYAEPTTPAAGIYLRARNYTPTTGRFTTTDPLPQDATQPYEQQYAYVSGAVTTAYDPTGMKGCSLKSKVEDLVTLHLGWNNGGGGSHCNKELRNSDNTDPMVDAAENEIDQVPGIVGDFNRGLLSGVTFGVSDYLLPGTGCTSAAYNAGIWTSVLFPDGGGIERGGASVLERDVFSRIRSTQPNYPGTIIPKSFNLLTSAGREIWVHPNATKHIEEEVRGVVLSKSLVTENLLVNLTIAVDSATRDGVQYGRRILSRGWELIFSPAREAGGNPVLKHARRV